MTQHFSKRETKAATRIVLHVTDMSDKLPINMHCDDIHCLVILLQDYTKSCEICMQPGHCRKTITQAGCHLKQYSQRSVN